MKRDQGAIEPYDVAVARKLQREVCFVRLLVGGIDDEQKVIAAVGNHQIIDDAALIVGQDGVALPARLEPQNFNRNKPLQRAGRVFQEARFRA